MIYYGSQTKFHSYHPTVCEYTDIADYDEAYRLALREEAEGIGMLKAILPPKSVWLVQPSHYTWFLTSAMFAAMTFAGYLSTQILRSTRAPRARAMVLLAYGGGLLAIGWVSEIWIPCIKPIFTLSFSAQAMGWCVLYDEKCVAKIPPRIVDCLDADFV